ncbi:Lrp/AsnC family transcriptional regulator [Pseudactinotalea terrae]|uniref:Lrp/AsnC family transcriptional regulator n=1 Tax=Pseudactinotalea terrae TaxID=1743262 RepID=UPI0012E2F2D6|nr:Lrp/AsnC family transcriptional regulator [Pseudactinotalea terrae]
MATKPTLDDLDRKILAILRLDGRRSFADVARDLDISIATVKRRVDRLEADGVVQGYAAVLDTAKLGLGFEAIVEVYCAEKTTPRDVLATISGLEEVISAVTVSGEPDAVLRVQVTDVPHLERVIEDLRRRPSIVRTRTMLVLSVLADRPVALRT